MVSSTKRIGSWNMASRRSSLKCGKRSRSTELLVSNWRKFSQLPVNSVARPRDPGILQHALGLRQQHRGLVQVVRGGVPQQFRIGHAGPEEIAQPAGQA